jgi:hypothetical protein
LPRHAAPIRPRRPAHTQSNSQNGKPKNKVEEVGMFFVRKISGATNHVTYAFHHKLTKQVPPQNSKNLQKPLQKPSSHGQYFFLANSQNPPSSFIAHQPMRREGHRHAASEVVLPNSIPQT